MTDMPEGGVAGPNVSPEPGTEEEAPPPGVARPNVEGAEEETPPGRDRPNVEGAEEETPPGRARPNA
jgi:hypothetical protein